MASNYYVIGDMNYNASTYGEEVLRDKHSTPRWMLDKGIYLDLPYSRKSRSFVSPRMPIRRLSDERLMGYALCPSHGLYNEGSPSTPSDASVISALAEKWRGTDLNLGMILSPEGTQSVSMMTEAILKLSNATYSLKRGDLGGFIRHLDHMPRGTKRIITRKYNSGDISGAFLSAHLGWEPLIKDVYSASNIEAPIPKGTRIAASKKGVPHMWRTDFSSYYGDPLRCEAKGKRTIQFIADIASPPSFTERFGLGNAFSIAWENVPLSFVADYFLPIGAVIDSMYFISQAKILNCWRKSYREQSLRATYDRSFRLWDSSGPCYCSGTFYLVDKEYSRTPYKLDFSSPLRGLTVTLPSSLMRLGTMSALLHQRLRSLR